MMAASYGATAVLSLVICWVSMRSGVRALEEAG
jgi:hypothetical protein